MALRERIVDFLGHVLGIDGKPATITAAYDLEACKWMEIARDTMASYVSAALQKSEIRFYSSKNERAFDDGAWLWNVSPNPNQSRAELIDGLVRELLCKSGEALIVPVKTGSGYQIYLASGFIREQGQGEDTFSGIMSARRQIPGTYRARDVYYFDLSASNGVSSIMRAAEQQYQSLAGSVIAAMRDHNAPKWVFELGSSLNGTPEQQKEQRESIQKNLERFIKANGAAVWPLHNGQVISRVSEGTNANPVTSSQVAEIRKDMFETVAECFRMPTSLLYGNTNNFTELLSSFLTFAVDPLAAAIGEELTRKTYTQSQWAEGARAVVDTTHVRHVDLFAVAGEIEKLVGSSIDSPNEIRGFTGQDPLSEPWADEYQRTKNHESAGGGE